MTVIPWGVRRYLVATLLVAIGAGLRAWPLQSLGTILTWLTFYPMVMVAAIYGGLSAGLLATALCCLAAVFGGPLLVGQPFITTSADWIGLAVFIFNAALMSVVAESMRRARVRAQAAQVRAEAANRAKSVFLASMSHELRTPLNAILGFTSLLRDAPDTSPEQRKTLDIVRDSGDHLLKLINDVLDTAKVEAGRVEVDPQPLDLGRMLTQLIDLMQMRAADKGLVLRLETTSQVPRFVTTDGDLFRAVLVNLVGNAIKFTGHGSVVLRVDAGPAPGASPGHDDLALEVEVEDTGSGIAPEDLARIFEPFVQVGSQQGRKGTGLGLAISRSYAGLLGGSIDVQSTLGTGSAFRVTIPVRTVADEDVSTIGLDRGRVIGLEPGQPEWRILIAEDQPENQMLLQRLLAGVGLESRIAPDGEQAVALFEAWAPHFIWMDIRMPVMDGLDATRRIRASEKGRDVKIVAVTASVLKGDHDEILAAGVDAIVRKPYRADEIYDAMTQQVDMRFIREGPAVSPDQHGGLSQKAIEALPREVRLALVDALISLDTERIRDLIGQVSTTDPALGDALATRANRLQFSAILSVLQEGPDPSLQPPAAEVVS